MRVREKLAWSAALVLALGVVASVAGVALGGPLDPPGPPAPTGPIQVQVVPGTPVNTEFNTVSVDCYPGAAFSIRAAAGLAAEQLDVLGADSWSLVGPPAVSNVAYLNQYGGTNSACSLTYTLQRPLGVGTPLTATPTATETPTDPPTATPGAATSTPTDVPIG